MFPAGAQRPLSLGDVGLCPLLTRHTGRAAGARAEQVCAPRGPSAGQQGAWARLPQGPGARRPGEEVRANGPPARRGKVVPFGQAADASLPEGAQPAGLLRRRPRGLQGWSGTLRTAGWRQRCGQWPREPQGPGLAGEDAQRGALVSTAATLGGPRAPEEVAVKMPKSAGERP